MAPTTRKYAPLAIPRPPKLRPSWTTWIWIAFAVSVVVATIVGLYYAASPRVF